MKGNQYASGLVRTEKTREKMRLAQQERRNRELRKRLRSVKVMVSSNDD